MSKILLHTCCAPCASFPMQDLLDSGFEVSLLYFNPNTHPQKEYEKRLKELEVYLNKFPDIKLIKAGYDSGDWFQKTKGYEKEPERGKRCFICYELRLAETARVAIEGNFDYFGSTLSISPHKDAKKISEIGKKIAKGIDIIFFDRDWKKNNGFKKSCEISKKEKFYRQDYCGCVYSRRVGK